MATGTPQDVPHAEEWFLKSAEQGNARAAYNLGGLYRRGGGGIEASEKRSAGWYCLAAQWGHMHAQYLYAACVFTGRGVERDAGAALEWFKLAGSSGHTGAQLRAGLMCLGIKDAGKEAEEWLRKAADKVCRRCFLAHS